VPHTYDGLAVGERAKSLLDIVYVSISRQVIEAIFIESGLSKTKWDTHVGRKIP
jgi:hypothetical protein